MGLRGVVFIASAIWVGSCAVATVALWRAGRAIRALRPPTDPAGWQNAVQEATGRFVDAAARVSVDDWRDALDNASRNRGGSARLR